MGKRGNKEVDKETFGEDFDIGLDFLDTVKSEAYLVSRGVRPLALVGEVEADPMAMLKAFNKVSYATNGMRDCSGNPVIPVVAERKGEQTAYVGYAARGWVVETFKWVIDNVPQPHLNRLLGLLLGYSVDAIVSNEESTAGRLFSIPTPSRQESQDAIAQRDPLHCTGEIVHPETGG